MDEGNHQLLSRSEDGYVRLWDVRTHRCVQVTGPCMCTHRCVQVAEPCTCHVSCLTHLSCLTQVIEPAKGHRVRLMAHDRLNNCLLTAAETRLTLHPSVFGASSSAEAKASLADGTICGRACNHVW